MATLDLRRQKESRSTSNAKAKLSKFSAELDADESFIPQLQPSLLPTGPIDLKSLTLGGALKARPGSREKFEMTGGGGGGVGGGSNKVQVGGGGMPVTLSQGSAITDGNWKSALVGCGSNSFNQLNFDAMELNSSTLKLINICTSSSSSTNTASKKMTRVEIQSMSCNANLTAIVVQESSEKENTQSSLYIWGDGIDSKAIRVPTLVPMSGTSVMKVSCGQTHCGVVTSDGRCFTWGSGEFGMTGLGTKTNVSSPKQVVALKDLFACDISCGAFHTGIIADEPSKVKRVEVPLSSAIIATLDGEGSPMPPLASATSSYQRLRDHGVEPTFLTCGSLYMCGLGKAGQLGLGRTGSGSASQAANQTVPTLVKTLQDGNLMVAKVSCGFHHTLVVTIPWDVAFNDKAFETKVFSMGWGEHGRLGHGDEESKFEPTEVRFPSLFHATDVVAGEQHSVAISISDHRPMSQSKSMPHYEQFITNCYSWGNNSMGQLGVGSPAVNEIIVTPQQIPIPEGMYIKEVAAGGRHSAAITYCGKLLSWGWGEEGQLGHGTEKSSYLPRPARIPRVKGVGGKPLALAMGMTHTLVLLENPEYSKPIPITISTLPVTKVVTQTPPKPPPPSPPPSPKITPVVVEEEIEVEKYDVRPAVICDQEECVVENTFVVAQEDDEEEEMIMPIRSVKELLHLREERLNSPPILAVDSGLQNETVGDAVEVDSVERPSGEDEEEEEEEEGDMAERSETQSPPPVEVDLIASSLEVQAPTSAESFVAAVALGVKEKIPEKEKVAVYYKDVPGQDLDSCLIANTAKRAAARKAKKEQQKK